MNEINPNQHNRVSFSGINNNQAAIRLENLLENALKNILKNADDIKEFGECPIIFEKIKNPLNNGATDYVLSISKPPAGVENHETIRMLELAAYRIPEAYKAVRTIATGTKAELLTSEDL